MWLATRPVSAVAKHGGAERERSSAEEMTDVGPESTVAGLDEEELAVLRHVGKHWGRALAGQRSVVARAAGRSGPAPLSTLIGGGSVEPVSRRSTSSRPTIRRNWWRLRTPAPGHGRPGAPPRCGVGLCWAHRCVVARSLTNGCASWWRLRSFPRTPSRRSRTGRRRCSPCSRSPAAVRWACR